MLMPPVNGAKFAKPKNTKKTLGRLLGYMGKYKFLLLFYCLQRDYVHLHCYMGNSVEILKENRLINSLFK